MSELHGVPSPFYQARRSSWFGARIVLIAAFTCLLAIVAAEGLDSLKIAKQIQVSQTQMRHEFLSRDRKLGEIRSGLYESGNVVRDYILVESDKNAAETLRGELKTIRDGMEAALKTYPGSVRSGERGPFEQLKTEVESYWLILDPIFHWDANARKNQGNWFLRHEVLPRRTTVLAMAREVSEVNQQVQQEEEGRMADLFAEFQRRVRVITAFGLGLGFVLAALTVAYSRKLEKAADERDRLERADASDPVTGGNFERV